MLGGNVNTVSKINYGERQNLCMEIDTIKLKIHELDDVVGHDGYEQLLSTISQQRWYGFKNKREIVFDSYTGYLFPNFEFMPHIKYSDWDKEKKKYEPNEIGVGCWTHLGTIFQRHVENQYYDYSDTQFSFPMKFAGKHSVYMYLYDRGGNYNNVCFSKFHKNGCLETDSRAHIADDIKVFPAFRVLKNDNLLPEYPRLTKFEKAKIILDFFIQNDWIPIFELHLVPKRFEDSSWFQFGFERSYKRYSGQLINLEVIEDEDEDEFQERINLIEKEFTKYNEILDAYYQRIQLQKQLTDLELQRDELPEPEPLNTFTSDFDYRQDLNSYDLSAIQNSVWQYSQASQQWINTLLNRIDEWENEHLNLVKNTVELNQELEKKLPVSINVTAEEKLLLEAQLQHLKKRLDLGLMLLRSNLINLLSESQQISSNLEQTSTLFGLAQLEQQARPSFELLAEHTATLCTKTLKEMEWLDQSLDFVRTVVSVLRKSAEDYLILVDKYQQDLIQIGLDNSIESEEIAKWFAEWRSERLSLLKQFQPLLDAGLNKLIDEQTVLDILPCIEQYQNELDQFYLQKRLGIHTTYAFQPNGHRQEKLEKEQELTKLVHQFMQQLEKVIFNTKTTAQKIWLIRFSEVWQQGMVNEITNFLAKEQLIERDDVVLIMSEELRKVQQQNLASCLQDAQSYSEALAQREKDVNTLIFKMRKALMK